MAKILVLGGNGFLGRNLLHYLSTTKHTIVSFCRRHTHEIYPNISYIDGEFEDINNYTKIFQDVDFVYHLISATKPSANRYDINYDIEHNIIPTINMLNICVDKNIKKVIFSSSGGAIYGNSPFFHKEDNNSRPPYAYGINKLTVEHYLDYFYTFHGLNYTVLRISNPFGFYHTNSTQGFLNILINKVKNNETLEIWGDGSVRRDYIWAEDVVNAFIKAQNNTMHKIFNIAYGKSFSIKELISMVEYIANKKIHIEYKKRRAVDIPINALDITSAKNFLNWKPQTSLEQGIEQLLNAPTPIESEKENRVFS